MKSIKKIFIILILFFASITISSCSFIEKIDPGDFDDY